MKKAIVLESLKLLLCMAELIIVIVGLAYMLTK